MLRAVLLDLDGTLLDIDMDRFMGPYVEALSASVSRWIEPGRFTGALMEATAAMVRSSDRTRTNETVFWEAFETRTGLDRRELAEPLERFYREAFPRLSSLSRPVPGAAEAVRALKALGLRLALATNAIFPAVAIEERIRWAGLDPADFEVITAYETMRACKPSPAYYEEACERLGVAPGRAVMAGNDLWLDVGAAARAGLHTFLIEGVQLPGEVEASFRSGSPPPAPDGRGSLADLVAWVRERL